MTSASKNNNNQSKPPKPTTEIASTSTNPNPSPMTISPEDETLSRSSHLTRVELLRRRSHNLKQLAKCYRDHYWALMEDLKAQHREYYWRYGVSPFREEKRRRVGLEGEGSGENGGVVDEYENSNCGSCMYGCQKKAMALTKYCQLHILKDNKQKLYTGCTNVIKRAPAGPLLCGKPTLASTVPVLCDAHFQKAQKSVAKALKDAGYNGSSTSKPPPKLHVIIAAFVHHIQAKRRNSQNESRKLKSIVKEENTS